MINRTVLSTGRAQLVSVIAQIRARWRLKLALRGTAIVGAAVLVALLVSAYGLEKLGFAAGAVITARVVVYLVVLGLAARFLVVPLVRRVSDEQVALYLEEHEPTLQAIVLSAVELGDDRGGAQREISPALARKTIETAIERCHSIDDGRRVDQRQIRRFGAAAVAAAIVGFVLVGFSPAFVRHGAKALLNPLTSGDAASPYRIDVQPGNVTIPRGADQEVRAVLHGFEAGLVEVVLRSGADSAFDRIPMAPGDSTGFELLLFDVEQPTDYFVESNGIRSPVYRIEVADLPYVKTLQLVYHFPAYTGLEPRVIEQGGDIAVLRGTVVEVRATPTIPTASGKIVIDGKAVPLTANAEDVLHGRMRVEKDGFYHLEMTARDGSSVNASPAYTIDILTDMPPTVTFTKPGRDTRVSSIQEVFIEARAEDDYGIAEVELVYSVNGGPEKTISMYRSPNALTEVTAGHTFYLEELALEPGDLVAYYARVKDNNAVAGRQTAKSDIYFLTVRPFGLDYRESQQAPAGGGGGGGGDNGRLSEMQREIIAATFNVQRDSAEDEEFQEKLNTIALSQERIRDQVQTLAQRMRSRGVTEDSAFLRISQLLPKAAEEMTTAVNSLRRHKPTEAMPAEQRALQQLLRAEAIFRDVQVSMGQQGGGGGGGGSSPNAEDLADLFELELDKLRNQYETVQRGERQQTESEVDEAMERLRELARRQQQEAERMRRQAQARQGGGGGGGGNPQSQRQLAEEAEEMARQLERLSRETQQPQLMDAARRLQQAADAMRRSAANSRSGNLADANAALDRIEEARRRLERNRAQQLTDESQELLRRAEQLVQQQRDIESGMNQLNNASGTERADQARNLIERKEQQVGAVENLERQLDRMASDARTNEREASRGLQEAANSIRDNQLKEKIRFSRALTQPGANPDYTREMEREIGGNLEELRDRIRDAGGSLGQGERNDRSNQALEQTRDLTRAMESLQERTRTAQDSAERRRLGQRPGQPGAQGQQGAPGQPGQQGQQRAQGQQGQQGMRGEGQQGQQGQQGQGQQGQQGGQQRGGGQPGDERGDGTRQPGGVYGPGGGGNAFGAIFPSGDVRQWRNEVRERLAETQRLRDQLAREGRDVSALEAVIRDMRALQQERLYATPRELEQLQASVVDGLKQFEYTLRRELQGEAKAKLFLSGTDEVPEGYRKAVQEYYRALSRRN